MQLPPKHADIKRLLLSGDWVPWFKDKSSTYTISLLQQWLTERYQTVDNPQRIEASAISNSISEPLFDVVWELVCEGILTPTGNSSTIRITQYGRERFASTDANPHDPSHYLKRLRDESPCIDNDTLMYVNEALRSFSARNYLATIVMVGVATECLFNRVIEAYENAVGDAKKKEEFKTSVRKNQISEKYKAVLSRLPTYKNSVPVELYDAIMLRFGPMGDLIRNYRNDVGHPSGRTFEHGQVHSILLMFPYYSRTAHEFMAWLALNHGVIC